MHERYEDEPVPTSETMEVEKAYLRYQEVSDDSDADEDGDSDEDGEEEMSLPYFTST